MKTVKNLEHLTAIIQETNTYFLNKAQQQVNTALTIRNWFIGLYIVEYEQIGNDRAKYGAALLKTLSKKLTEKGIKSLQERNLYLCRDFYRAYPHILQTPSAKLYLSDFELLEKLQTVSAKLPQANTNENISQLLTRLSFSHFIELLKADSEVKRRFYEAQTIQNNWPVKALKRAIEGLLYERTGLCNNKSETVQDFNKKEKSLPEALFRNTYLLEFLGLEEKAAFTESDLEERIITNLQHFLLELGKGFCFEHRQRRITLAINTIGLIWCFITEYSNVMSCWI